MTNLDFTSDEIAERIAELSSEYEMIHELTESEELEYPTDETEELSAFQTFHMDVWAMER